MLSEPNANVIVQSDGSVLWVPPVRVTHRCDLDRTNWPRDEAVCLLKFGSWTFDGNHLNLSLYNDAVSSCPSGELAGRAI